MRSCGVGLLAVLAGCATCKQHPVVCTAVVVVATTSVALSLNHGHSSGAPTFHCDNSACLGSPR